MLNARIAPLLLVEDGELYKTINFANPKYIGDPLNTVRIFNEKEVDELIVIDIKASTKNNDIDWDLITHISRECRMPLCYGGGVNSVEKVERLVSLGVEKVAIGYASFLNPKMVRQAINRVGKQSIVGILDVKKNRFSGKYEVYVYGGKKKTKMNHIEYSKYLLDLGVGEIILQNIDLDGTMKGFNLNLINEVYQNIDIPLTVLGGAGSLNDIKSLIQKFNIIGIAAGSIFVFKGKHKAVLVNYPDRDKKIDLFKRHY